MIRFWQYATLWLAISITLIAVSWFILYVRFPRPAEAPEPIPPPLILPGYVLANLFTGEVYASQACAFPLAVGPAGFVDSRARPLQVLLVPGQWDLGMVLDWRTGIAMLRTAGYRPPAGEITAGGCGPGYERLGPYDGGG